MPHQLPEAPPPPDDPPPPEKLDPPEELDELQELPDPPDPPVVHTNPPMEALPLVRRSFLAFWYQAVFLSRILATGKPMR